MAKLLKFACDLLCNHKIDQGSDGMDQLEETAKQCIQESMPVLTPLLYDSNSDAQQLLRSSSRQDK